MACPKCHRKITFEYYNNDGIGPFICKNCGLDGTGKADYSVENTDFAGRQFTVRGVVFHMPCFAYDMPSGRHYRISCGAVAPTPVRARDAEEILECVDAPDEATLERAAEAAIEDRKSTV